MTGAVILAIAVGTLGVALRMWLRLCAPHVDLTIWRRNSAALRRGRHLGASVMLLMSLVAGTAATASTSGPPDERLISRDPSWDTSCNRQVAVCRDCRIAGLGLSVSGQLRYGYDSSTSSTTPPPTVATNNGGRKHGPAQPAEDVLAALPKGTSGNSRVREVGSDEELDDVFDKLAIGGADGAARPGYSKVIVLPNGTTIGLRDKSSAASGGGRTIDVQTPGQKDRKVHIKQ